MKKIIFLCLLLCITSTISYSQHTANTHSTLTVKFKYTSKATPDTLSVWTYPANNYWETSTDYNIKKDDDQNFRIVFPQIKQLLNYRINIWQNNRITEIGNYFAMLGDDVLLNVYQTIDRDSLVFSGTGSEKYQLINELLKHERKLKRTIKYPLKDATPEVLTSYIDNMYSSIQKAMKEKRYLINGYPGVDKDMKEIIGYHYANYDVSWTNYLLGLRYIFKDNTTAKEIIKNKFNDHYAEFLDTSTAMSIFSQPHYQVLLNKFSYKLFLNSNKEETDLKSLYELAKSYSSDTLIRDRILCQFLAYNGKNSNNFSQSVFDSLLNDASVFLKSEMFEKILDSKSLFKKGSTFFDAKFVDLNGHIFDTSSLRGKVFLFKGWGIGCGGCIAFHTWFETDIWPQVKDLKDFVVLSVFDGKDKATWDQGIASNKYTAPHYLNISNMPYRLSEHPFYQHYRVNYMPFILLVDKKGEIIANFKTMPTPDKFIALIKDLINEL